MMELKLFSRFPKTFWTANTLELFERWAWYGMFNVLAIYLTASTDTGALGFRRSKRQYDGNRFSFALFSACDHGINR